MIVDGRAIAQKIKGELKKEIEDFGFRPKLVAVQVGHNPASESFLKIKKRVGEEVGILVEVISLPDEIQEEELVKVIEENNDDGSVHGIIVQLPLPPGLNKEKVLGSIDQAKDPDLLSGKKTTVNSPVVSAIEEILQSAKVNLTDKKIVVLGYGDLVGKPVAKWLKQMGISPFIINGSNSQADLSAEALAKADLIISGAGSPGIITSEKIKTGAVVIDAGTSEQGGRLLGDLDSGAHDKCSLYTPVPGGVGPVAVAVLFKNLAVLARKTRNG